ncbi:Bax inhibitor-1 family protein [Perilla frutescens var. hirtella]|nr:Bax inhibitor-1 family protein [Perilla frutescens var. hirtella]
MSNEKGDVEAALLYPSMQENPDLRWAFIRKVYSILTIQLLVTVAVAAVVVANPPIAIFFISWIGLTVYVAIIITLVIVLILLVFYENRHPLNFFLLGILTLCYGLVIGLATSFVSGLVILEAGIATAVVVVSLTAYTFWASKRGQDFEFLRPFLMCAILTLTMFTIFLIFFPMRRVSEMIYSGLAVLIFSAYVIYDTNQLIKQHSYDQYIWASIQLYLDILNIFVRLLQIFRAVNR